MNVNTGGWRRHKCNRRTHVKYSHLSMSPNSKPNSLSKSIGPAISERPSATLNWNDPIAMLGRCRRSLLQCFFFFYFLFVFISSYLSQSRFNQRHLRWNTSDVHVFGGVHCIWIHQPRECSEEFQCLRSPEGLRSDRVCIWNRTEIVGEVRRNIRLQIFFGAGNYENDIGRVAGFLRWRHGKLG